MMIPYGSARMGLIRTSVTGNSTSMPKPKKTRKGNMVHHDKGGSFPYETPVTRSSTRARARAEGPGGDDSIAIIIWGF